MMREPPGTIVVVEDEPDLAEAICFHLAREGYRCRAVHDGRSALAEILGSPPDLIILDRMLPGLSGDELISRLRRTEHTRSVPVIMLTAKAEDTDELVGFALGADDYIRKPVSMPVLLAHVSAVLRRVARRPEPPERIELGPVVLDRGRHEVRVEGRPVELRATEFRILATLMQARGRVLEREQIIDAAIGPHVAVTPRTIDVHVAALRRKLGPAGAWIRTVRGVGYAFRRPEPAGFGA